MLRPARNAIQMTFQTPGHIDHGLEKMQVKRPSQKLNLLKTSVFFDNRRAEGNLLTQTETERCLDSFGFPHNQWSQHVSKVQVRATEYCFRNDNSISVLLVDLGHVTIPEHAKLLLHALVTSSWQKHPEPTK